MLADCRLMGVNCPMGIDSRCPKRVKDGRDRRVDGTAGPPQFRKYSCVPALTLRATNGSELSRWFATSAGNKPWVIALTN
jgi:hypothetical protein